MSALDDVVLAVREGITQGNYEGWKKVEDARFELAQLRADLQAEQARIARIDTDNRTLISEYKTLEDRYTEQARQLDAAREIIGMAKNDYQSDVQDGVDSYDKGQRCIDWLAANPAPQETQYDDERIDRLLSADKYYNDEIAEV